MSNSEILSAKTAQRVALSDAILDGYLAELSHELKNLLNSAILISHIPPDRQQLASVVEAKRQVQSHSKEIILLIDNLRDLSQLSQGGGGFTQEETDLVDCVTAAVVQARDFAEPLGIDICFGFRQRLLLVSVCRRRLERMICSVLLELIAWCREDEQIELIADQDGQDIVLRFVAGSPRITHSELEQSLRWPEPDQQISDGLHKRLRLPLVGGLTQWHGGSVTTEARASGPGCELVLRLPVVAG